MVLVVKAEVMVDKLCRMKERRRLLFRAPTKKEKKKRKKERTLTKPKKSDLYFERFSFME